MASGLRWCSERLVKNTFIHFDDADDQDLPDLKKCVSDLLDSVPSRWSSDAGLEAYIRSIVARYRSPRPSPLPSALLGAVSSSCSSQGADSGAASSPCNGVECASASCTPKGVESGAASSSSKGAESGELDTSPGELDISPGRFGTSPGGAESLELDTTAGDADSLEEDQVRCVSTPGSALHGLGRCKPCAWHRKPAGCSKGNDCDFCHECEFGVVAQRKKERRAKIREYWRQVKAAR